MKTRTFLFGAAAVAAASGLALAHHVSVPLSHVESANILKRVLYYDQPQNSGLPAYKHSDQEFGHHQIVQLSDGASFSVIDGHGTLETVTLHASDFADIGNVDVEEVVDVVSGRSALIDAFRSNNYLIAQGAEGGSSASLELVDGPGSPLSVLGLAAPTVEQGSRDVVLTLSIPAEEPAHGNGGGNDDGGVSPLAGHPYLVLVSATDERSNLLGAPVPIGRDDVMRAFLRLTEHAVTPDFTGLLDAGGDAEAVLTGDVLDLLFDDNKPDELYLAYVVFDETMSSIEFVSNRFTIEFVK